MEQKRQLPNSKVMIKMRQRLQCQFMINLPNDPENQWVKVTEEMEVETASGNNQWLSKHLCDTGEWRTSVSEIVYDGNEEFILGRQQRFDLWVEHFMDQFGCLRANVASPTTTAANPWVSFDLLKEMEVE